MNKGIFLALSAYIFWGLHPIYWKLLQHVPSPELVSHRIVWSFVFFAIVLSIRNEWKSMVQKCRQCPKKWILYVPALLIGSNWAMYIWAVNAGFIIETSLGYFICPLISVFLGVLVLGERLRSMQWIAIIIAATGVVAMTVFYGQFPWISLYLAGTWAVYGMLRKQSPLDAVEGLTLETALMMPIALGYLTYVGLTATPSFLSNTTTSIMLIGAGVTSGLPLIVFIIAARLIKLSVIGFLQYIYPTLIFMVGAFIYHEPLSEAKMIGFTFIWLALIVYTIDGTLAVRRSFAVAAE